MVTQKTATKINGIDLHTLQETIEAIKQNPELAQSKFRVSNRWIDANHNCTTVGDFHCANQEMKHSRRFEMHADEPPLLAGGDQAANPVEHLLNALASCVTTSLVAHAAVRGIRIEEVESQLEGDIDLRGFLGLADVPKGYTDIRVRFKVKTDETDMDKLKRLAEFSPVFNTITRGAKVDIQIEPK